MLKTFVVSCLLALITCQVNADEASQSDGRIVNGLAIHISHAPHNVQLKKRDGGLFCGGTLVTPLHVVSAAHCFPSITAEDTRVVAGATSTNEKGQERGVVKIVIPEDYTSTTMHKDVAILKLDNPVDLNHEVNTVPLCTEPVQHGSPLLITGWGTMQSGGYVTDSLRVCFSQQFLHTPFFIILQQVNEY